MSTKSPQRVTQPPLYLIIYFTKLGRKAYPIVDAISLQAAEVMVNYLSYNSNMVAYLAKDPTV